MAASLAAVLSVVVLQTSPAMATTAACPADIQSALDQQPERLASCPASDRRTRSYVAQALAKVGRRDEAASAYRALAKDWPGLAEAFELRAVELSPTTELSKPTGRRWLDRARARSALDASARVGGESLQEAATAALAAGLDGAGVHLSLLRGAAAAGKEAGVREELRLLRTRFAGSPEEAEGLKVAKNPPSVAQLGEDELARRWSGWAARAGAGEVAAECLPMTRRSERSGEALLACGRALATVRNDAAADVLERAARSHAVDADALLALARVKARGTAVTEVVKVCDRLARVRKAAHQRADCDFLAAFQTLQHGRRSEGRRRLEQVMRDHRKSARAADASWLLAFEDWSADRKAAGSRFDALVRAARDADDKAQALYWRGRAQSDHEAAKSDWREARRLDPLGYYGLLSATQLGDRTVRTSVADAPATADESTAFARSLLEAGLVREAGWELAEKLSARKADPAAWGPVLEAAGRFDLILKIGQSHGGHGGAWPPESSTRRASVRAAFPLAFPGLLAASTEVDANLIRALMRRESGFDPRAASAAEARGLLQLLPTTATRVAELARLPLPEPEALFDPATNVSIATAYVARLAARFRHPLVVAAAYNAGPKAVTGWLAERAGMPVDEWVERIPFRETRAYVKAVAGSLGAYGLVWEGAYPPVSVGPVPSAGEGIDF